MELWLKALHVIAVISWMAGLLYLPRLFVYHVVERVGSGSSELFKVMERRLLKFIMTPALFVVWVTGLWLATMAGYWSDRWFQLKFLLVLGMSASHFGMWLEHLSLTRDERRRTQKFYRIFNEVPTILMIFVVILVVVRPFA